MASFPTLPGRLVPWTANALTVAVLLAVTWWSSAQRPGEAPASPGTLTARASTAQSNTESKKQATSAPGPTPPGLAQARGDVSTATGRLPGEALVPVVYQPAPPALR